MRIWSCSFEGSLTRSTIVHWHDSRVPGVFYLLSSGSINSIFYFPMFSCLTGTCPAAGKRASMANLGIILFMAAIVLLPASGAGAACSSGSCQVVGSNRIADICYFGSNNLRINQGNKRLFSFVSPFFFPTGPWHLYKGQWLCRGSSMHIV